MKLGGAEISPLIHSLKVQVGSAPTLYAINTSLLYCNISPTFDPNVPHTCNRSRGHARSKTKCHHLTMELLPLFAERSSPWSLPKSEDIGERQANRLEALEIVHLLIRHVQNAIAHRLQRGATARLEGESALICVECDAVQLDVDLEIWPQLVARAPRPARQLPELGQETHTPVQEGPRPRIAAEGHGCV